MLLSFAKQLNSYASVEQTNILIAGVQKLDRDSLKRTCQSKY